jgi:nicotinate phosphoribosyltransferase
VTIFASGNLDEYRLRELVAKDAPISGFGIGTRMNTSADAPYLDCAYKLEEYEGRARRKRSEGKATWPGRKQVYRTYDRNGRCAGDTLTLVDDETGRPCGLALDLDTARERARRELARLPEALRGLDPAPPYPVVVAPALRALAAAVDAST